VLDVGCGEGEVATLLEREGHRVVTADPARAGALPFDDESFDTVLLGDFLAEWTSHDRPLAEARRVLRPGGRLIVAVPYAAGPAADGLGISIRVLLGELGEFAVGEVATVDDRLCVLAERMREKSRAAVWRRALGLAEERLAEREEAAAALTASVVELKASREREERALADARDDVERLETALAAATHRRDLEQEKARLAGAGVAELEQRLERLRQDRDRERAEAERELERHAAEAERQVAEARARLELREEELERGQAAAQEAQKELGEARELAQKELEQAREELGESQRELAVRERELAVRLAELDAVGKQLVAREQELAELREKLGESERELALRERDLAARVRELGQAGEVLVARERELEIANEQLASRGSELDAAVAELAEGRSRLEVQDAELAEGLSRLAAQGTELTEVRNRLAAREQHLKTAQLGVESRDRRLEVAERAKASRDAELERLRTTVRERERKLALSEARLEKAQQRAESFRSSLVALREGRAYRLMRVLWRLRRPFRRAPRDAATSAPSGQDDADSGPPAATAPRPAAPAAAIADREPSPPRGDRLCVASILDEMSEACFAPECDLVPLALEDWREQLDRRRPDLLLVESAWSGNGGEWQYRIAQYPRKDLAGLPALRALIDGCRERGIPTAFWNKEDPVHFDRFSEAASLFDHVFTTDAGCVERYRALPGERTVEPLPFAAQPRIHNPVAAVAERSASPCFAGAWYRDRHPERRHSLEALLDAARPRGLVIYDRRFGSDDAAFGFPERFAPHVLGKLPYERILDVYKGHRVFLNANSVADSPTMCSRRVFELAACDTAILSTPGAALEALLGEGMVEEAGDEEGATAALERLLGDEGERSRRTRAARRAVFAAHTYEDRLATIAAAAGIDASSLRREPFAPPGASNGVAVPTNGATDPHPWQLALQPGLSLAEPALADLAAATTFAEADVIGVHPARNGDAAVEHRHVTDLDPRLLLLRRELVESRGRPAGSPEQIRAQLREWSDDGIRLYAADADLLFGRSGGAVRQ
jgi:SAM-dependent methyltransferase/glycosyltransferase involved in cell wall biosynthesis